MVFKRPKPEAIVTTSQQVEVLTGKGCRVLRQHRSTQRKLP